MEDRENSFISGAEVAKVSRKGFFSKNSKKISCEDSMEKFRVSNIEIFRRAFGDSHYFVKAGREEGLISQDDGSIAGAQKDCDFARASRRGISSNDDDLNSQWNSSKGNSAQSGKFSEYVQKVHSAKPQGGRVADKYLPFAVYVEKFDISNSKVKLKLSDKEYLSIRAS